MAYPPQQPQPYGWAPQPTGTPPEKRRTGLIIGVVVAAVVVLGGVTTWLLWPSPQPQSSSAPPPDPGTTATPPGETTSCEYSRTSEQPARNVGLPGNAGRTPASGTVRLTLKTGQGDIPMTLDRAKAPCGVQNLVFLSGKKYFDGSPCHRLTVSDGFKVLQCGDPTGTGRGGPGYEFDDELPKDLEPAGADAVIYPAGTVAMANAGADTNGSQFFLVYGDTTLAPNYSVLGTYGTAGQTTIEKIASGGVDPRPEMPSPGDGSPRTRVTIQQATIEN